MRKLLYIVILLILSTSCRSGSDEVSPLLAIILSDTQRNPYENHLDSAPDDGCVRLRTRFNQPIGRVFNDLNDAHLAEARKGGIRPVSDDAMAWSEGRNLVEIKSNPYYFVDELSHSYPFLRPHAADLLAEICRRFRDSLQARGGGAYRPKVTSLLRTPLSVSRLRRVNRNATGESAHQYATTFDISYSKFICDDAGAPHRTFEDLKNLLAEIIVDMQSKGRCLVKHERLQACFHITAAAMPDSLYNYD